MQFSIMPRTKKSKKVISPMKFDYQEELVDDVSESEGELPPTLDSGDSTS